jgi:hypothetical protein
MTGTLRLRKSDLVWSNVDDSEVVALDTSRSVYLSVNSSGSVLWPVLERGATREELVRVLRDSFSLDQPTAERDVEAFLADMRAHGILDEA